MRGWLGILCLVVLIPRPASADWQIKPFGGVEFGGSTSFLDYENAAGRAHFILGVNAGVLGEVLGIEADLARVPGFFETDEQLVLSSSATTLTGNVVVAVPRRLFQYTLRPYFVAGAGIIHAQIEGRFGTLRVASTLPALDLGGGATGFLSDRVGLNWELRYFRSFKGSGELNGVSVTDEQLAFWRATMAVVFRY